MAVVKVTSVKIEVELPMHEVLTIFKERTIDRWISVFSNYILMEKNPERKANYNRCREVLKYTKSSGGGIGSVSSYPKSIVFELSFNDIETAQNFVSDLPKIIEKSTM